MRTPYFDQIACEGVTFRHAFVNAPSCTPSRSSLFSGRHFFNTGLGAILRGAVWDFSMPSYPLLLRDAGYHIGRSYMAWGPGTPSNAPFGDNQYAYERAGGDPNNFSEEMTERVQRGRIRSRLSVWPLLLAYSTAGTRQLKHLAKAMHRDLHSRKILLVSQHRPDALQCDR